MTIINQLNEIIAERSLLTHPFYQAWSKGELNQAILKRYAVQYYAQVESFPRFISRVHTNCPEIAARKVLVDNLADEEMRGTDHPSLWVQFAEGLGATREEMKKAVLLPETQKMVDTFYALAERDWRDGLCALYAYEQQVPAVSISKTDGLQKFYGIDDERTLEFFAAHQVYDVEHAQQVATLIEQYVDVESAKRATCEAADALLGFLDGMCRVENIICYTDMQEAV